MEVTLHKNGIAIAIFLSISTIGEPSIVLVAPGPEHSTRTISDAISSSLITHISQLHQGRPGRLEDGNKNVLELANCLLGNFCPTGQ